MIEIETGSSAAANPTVLFRNVFEQGTVTLISGGGTVANALDGNTYDFWTGTSAPMTARVDLGSAQTCDCLCIAAHNLGTRGASVEVITEAAGPSFTSRAVHTPTDDSAIMLIFPAASSAIWRVRVNTATASVGVLMLGQRLTLPGGIVGDYTPTNWAKRVDMLGGTTLGGQFMGQRVIRRGGETVVSPGTMDRAWWETNGAAFQGHYDDGKPFFYAGAPSILPRDVAYCWRPEGADEMRPAIVARDLVALNFEASFYA